MTCGANVHIPQKHIRLFYTQFTPGITVQSVSGYSTRIKCKYNQINQ